jgi:DNA mismatch repair ATPase MutS
MMLSTHNHGLIDRQKADIKPYHFKFDIRDGKVDYHYTLQEGHERSHALEVARTMDLPEEILAGVK